jgi:hypothetical protein
MLKSYMKFIFDNVENPIITTKIIYINKKMLYNLNKNKNNKNNNLFVGGQSDSERDKNIKQKKYNFTDELDKFTKDTITIINAVNEPFKLQQETIKKSKMALDELIKYINMLYDYVKKEDLIVISKQLSELQKKLNAL